MDELPAQAGSNTVSISLDHDVSRRPPRRLGRSGIASVGPGKPPQDARAPWRGKRANATRGRARRAEHGKTSHTSNTNHHEQLIDGPTLRQAAARDACRAPAGRVHRARRPGAQTNVFGRSHLPAFQAAASEPHRQGPESLPRSRERALKYTPFYHSEA